MSKRDLIAQAIKDAGYNTRQVSLRSRPCGYSWSFEITIRDPKIEVAQVEAIVGRFEKVDRDEGTGEILCGGNTFVDINISDEVRNIWAAKYMDQVVEVMANLTEEYGKSIGSATLFLNNGWSVKIWDDRPHIDRWIDGYYQKSD